MTQNLRRRTERLETVVQASGGWVVIRVREGQEEGAAVAEYVAARGLRQRPEKVLFIVR